jgi:hypothetical protein
MVPKFGQALVHGPLYGPEQNSSRGHQGEKNEKLYAVSNQTVKGLIDRFTAFLPHRGVHIAALPVITIILEL